MTTALNEFSNCLPDSKMSFPWVISADARFLIKIHCLIFSLIHFKREAQSLRGCFEIKQTLFLLRICIHCIQTTETLSSQGLLGLKMHYICLKIFLLICHYCLLQYSTLLAKSTSKSNYAYVSTWKFVNLFSLCVMCQETACSLWHVWHLNICVGVGVFAHQDSHQRSIHSEPSSMAEWDAAKVDSRR